MYKLESSQIIDLCPNAFAALAYRVGEHEYRIYVAHGEGFAADDPWATLFQDHLQDHERAWDEDDAALKGAKALVIERALRAHDPHARIVHSGGPECIGCLESDLWALEHRDLDLPETYDQEWQSEGGDLFAFPWGEGRCP